MRFVDIAVVGLILPRHIFGFFLFFALQMVFRAPERRFGSVFRPAAGTGPLFVLYLFEPREYQM